jgi:hypothetical protein
MGKLKAGVRMPYFTFTDGTQILDHLKEPAFKILFFGDADSNSSRQLNDIKITIVAKTFAEIPAALFGQEKNFYILLRPDNHISYIGKDITRCRELLDKIVFQRREKEKQRLR